MHYIIQPISGTFCKPWGPFFYPRSSDNKVEPGVIEGGPPWGPWRAAGALVSDCALHEHDVDGLRVKIGSVVVELGFSASRPLAPLPMRVICGICAFGTRGRVFIHRAFRHTAALCYNCAGHPPRRGLNAAVRSGARCRPRPPPPPPSTTGAQ